MVELRLQPLWSCETWPKSLEERNEEDEDKGKDKAWLIKLKVLQKSLPLEV